MNRLALILIVLACWIPGLCSGETWEEYQQLRLEAEQPKMIPKGGIKPKIIPKDIIIQQLSESGTVDFNSDSILFEYGRAKVREDYKPQLKELADSLASDKLKEFPYFFIDGHTCDIGTDRNNCRLSWERSQAIVQYLVDNGIDRSKLIPRGFGEGHPNVPNVNEENRKQNRRVAVTGGKLPRTKEMTESDVCREYAVSEGGTSTSFGSAAGQPGKPSEPSGSTGWPGGEAPSNVESLVRRAESGDASAQCRLGDIHFNGIGTLQDYGEAARWYRMAIDQGHECRGSKGFMAAKELILKGKSLNLLGKPEATSPPPATTKEAPKMRPQDMTPK